MNDYNVAPTTAALYLLTVARYQRTAKTVVRAAVRSLAAIEELTSADGLTIAKPDYEFQFLVGNAPVYAGLVEGGDFFRKSKRHDEADRVFQAADRLAAAMEKFIDKGRFLRTIHVSGAAEGGLSGKLDVLPNLMGFAHFKVPGPADDLKPLWKALVDEYKPDTGRVAVMPVEEWLPAADRAAPEDVQKWCRDTANEALKFDSSLYLDRFANAALALLDGPGRYPAVLSGVRE